MDKALKLLEKENRQLRSKLDSLQLRLLEISTEMYNIQQFSRCLYTKCTLGHIAQVIREDLECG